MGYDHDRCTCDGGNPRARLRTDAHQSSCPLAATRVAAPQRPLTPEERYHRDVQFKTLVDTLEAQIHAANFTPTELREAAVLACCNYEMRRTSNYVYLVAEGRYCTPIVRAGEPPDALVVDGVNYRRAR